jgi:predicted transcriptional regulator
MPAISKREKNRRAFVAMMEERGLTRAKVAELLHMTVDAVKAWLKHEAVAGSNPVPAWAPELLEFKMPSTAEYHRRVSAEYAHQRKVAKKRIEKRTAR